MTRSVVRSLRELLGAGTICLAAIPPEGAHDGTLCARPEVLAFARERLRQTEAHATLLADTASETATAQATVVLCVIGVQIRMYDWDANREYPAVIWQPRYFEVRQLDDGFEIDFTGR